MGEQEQRLMLMSDCKTRWNSLDIMISSVLRVETPFFSLVSQLTDLKFSGDEIKVLKDLHNALNPLKHVSEMIGKDSSDLLTAEAAFKTMLKHLDDQENNPVAAALFENVREEFEGRRNGPLVSLLQQLHNPKKEKDRETTNDMFPRSSKYSIEKLAKTLMNRLFQQECDSSSETDEEQPSPSSGNLDFAKMLHKAVN